MSDENVEILRRIFDLVNERDVGAVLDNCSDEFVMDWSNSKGPAKGVYRGRKQVEALWVSFMDAFDSLEWNAEEIVAVDGVRLIVVNRNRVRGRGSGAKVEAVGAQLWTFRDGTARGVKLYQSKAEALEAAGMSE